MTRRHLLSSADLSRDEVDSILDTAASMHDVQRREVKKLPTLRGRTVINLFFEDSTRTRSSFEIAGKWMSADHKGITITDNGRGIPVDMHPQLKIPAVVAVFTKLGAGGKFDGQSYKHSGGLHGVGAAVANALAEVLTAKVWRDGSMWEVGFVRGVPEGKLKKLGNARGSGTSVYLRPDPEIFGVKSTQFDPAVVRERLEAKSYLHKGLKIVFTDESTGKTETLFHAEGISEYLGKLVQVRGKPSVHPGIFYLERLEEPKLEVACAWTEASDDAMYSLVASAN